ncbi:hypothetical protein BN874_1840004 [Candidatus Contendobacter odensis Run_B_J11]|uniref:Uncharacterized protein n=1 Tax=Candidatus Contendobacter odensis Run_B_J11 TaxID=1400861 RepID=A0A7U7GAP4_9GAMM|nr:hypothetical protein BN874_1840004 [Candidatus Contendobacter odensis Run_B_J11]
MDWACERLQQAEQAPLETWALRVLSAASLEDVFAAGSGH